MFLIFVRGVSNKYPKHMFYKEIRIKQRLFLHTLHISLLIQCSVQQQIHLTGNVFGNKYYRCNEVSLYTQNKRNAKKERNLHGVFLLFSCHKRHNDKKTFQIIRLDIFIS